MSKIPLNSHLDERTGNIIFDTDTGNILFEDADDYDECESDYDDIVESCDDCYEEGNVEIQLHYMFEYCSECIHRKVCYKCREFKCDDFHSEGMV